MVPTSTHDITATPAGTPDQAALAEARLSLDPATSRGPGIHGGWWPRSRDAAAELPALLTELSAQAARASRIALQVDAFSNIPHQLTIGGRKVHVAWFRHMNPHTAILTMAGRDDLILLIVPPQASPEAAAEALRRAASGRHAGAPEAILAAAAIAADGEDGVHSRNVADQQHDG
jgi:Family of unknown function (DUF5994)